jgi:hypothetical protein
MPASNEAVCRTCGACCAYSATWPRFGLETEAEIAMIPREYVDDARGTMRCIGDRCVALAGEVGVMTTCTLYALRPQVCRACEPGDESCAIAREHIGLPPVKPLAFEAP